MMILKTAQIKTRNNTVILGHAGNDDLDQELWTQGSLQRYAVKPFTVEHHDPL